MRYYVVVKGRVPGIYTSWNKCKEQVTGFSGAVYRGFDTEQEAHDFMWSSTMKARVNTYKPSPNTLCAYVDGSYSDDSMMYGSAVVFVLNNKVVATLAKSGNSESYLKMRNVAGEIHASMMAMEYARTHEISELVIYHDYEGIAKWCSGEWEARVLGTRMYKDYFNGMSKFVNVSFRKVTAHTGDTFNELADHLAKAAIGIC